MSLHEIAVLVSLIVSVVVGLLQVRQWLRERDVSRREDYEVHTMAAAKADNLAVTTILAVLAAREAENQSLRDQVAQLSAEIAGHRARLENTS